MNRALAVSIFGFLSMLLGVLSIPLGSPKWLDYPNISLFTGIFSINVAILTFFSSEKLIIRKKSGLILAAGLLFIGLATYTVGGKRGYLMAGYGAIFIVLIGALFVRLLKTKEIEFKLTHVGAMIGFVLGLQGLGYFSHSLIQVDSRREALARAENAVINRLKSGHVIMPRFQGHTIDLSPYVNTRTDASFFHETIFDDSYAALPSGRQILGGIPFDVEGITVLSGRLALRNGITNYPSKVDIRIGSQCQKLYFLGGFHAMTTILAGDSVAKITLKYVDGSEWETELKTGVNVANKFGFEGEILEDKRSEIVWVGTNGMNEFSSYKYPWFKLRTIKTTVINPHPSREITSLSYESSMHEASPFLIALTVE